jgi:hypothetical protein
MHAHQQVIFCSEVLLYTKEDYKKGCTRLAAASDKVYQLLAHSRWFSPASSTTKNGRHDIGLVEILLKVVLKTINQSTIPTSMSVTNNKSIHNSYIHVCNKQ